MHITLNNNFTEDDLTETWEIHITEVVLKHAAQLSSCSLVNTAENGNTDSTSTFKTDRSKSRPELMFKASYLNGNAHSLLKTATNTLWFLECNFITQ
jgi:hypothetical protein